MKNQKSHSTPQDLFDPQYTRVQIEEIESMLSIYSLDRERAADWIKKLEADISDKVHAESSPIYKYEKAQAAASALRELNSRYDQFKEQSDSGRVTGSFRDYMSNIITSYGTPNFAPFSRQDILKDIYNDTLLSNAIRANSGHNPKPAYLKEALQNEKIMETLKDSYVLERKLLDRYSKLCGCTGCGRRFKDIYYDNTYD